ncbi:MAG TPA: glucose-6-phosphate dehydrogenase assembly protein OpcA [Bryobacteraceae bacterium]|nr:glucose-6-phosphate dehydrogenase assembly protein OpcA [Bryobacteraceae bacterium]
MGGTIAPDRILHDMADLWVSLGKQGEGEAGVLRACSMTLVVAAEESDDPQAIGETLAALMPEHPSRAIVLRFRAEDQRSLAARVFAQCWMPFGHRQQICCEQIEITASDASLPDLAAVVLPLKVPDLPVVLWCRSPRLFRLPAFSQLASVAQKVVLDSGAFSDQAAALREIRDAVAAGRSLSDLSWTRLTRWRELIAQIFENRAQLANLPLVSEILISHRAASPPATAFYLAAWLVDGLAKVGAHPRVQFRSDGGDPAWRLGRIELRAPGSADPIASIALAGGQAAEVRVGHLVSRTLLPALNDYALMREELSIPGRDPSFERALAAAAELALS